MVRGRHPAACLADDHRPSANHRLLRRSGNERSKLAQLDMKHNPDEGRRAGHDRRRSASPHVHVLPPALSMEAHVALTLKVVSTCRPRRSSAAHVREHDGPTPPYVAGRSPTPASPIAFHQPAPAERLDGVLAVIYLVFTAGYAASADDDLAAEGIRLGRLLVELMPDSDGRVACLPDAAPARSARRTPRRGRAGDPRGSGSLAVGRRRDQRGAHPPSGRRGRPRRIVSRPTSPPFTPRRSTPGRRTGYVSSPSMTSC